MEPDETRAFWDGEAATFDQEPDHGLADPDTRAAWWRLLFEYLPAAPARVADLGCGTGSLSLLLAEHGYEVSGIDLSEQMITTARTKLRDFPQVSLAVGDAGAPALPTGSFDAVLARHVVWALPDPRAGLRRWLELLKPGGRLVLVEGFWFTGAGLRSDDLLDLLPSQIDRVTVTQLTDPVLWGRVVDDERYVVTARAPLG